MTDNMQEFYISILRELQIIISIVLIEPVKELKNIILKVFMI